MSLEAICAGPPHLRERIADSAILFLWVPMPKLREGLTVIKEWGFEYKTGMVWVKNSIGMGYYCRSKHELLLIATHGEIGPPQEGNRPESVIESPRTGHSEKPECVYDIIERMYPDYHYLELFGRKKRKGWEVWGNEL
jgi:N6-adenosine-specific RNA methylase IME4